VSAALDAILGAEMARWESRGLRRDLDAQSRASFERDREFTSNDYVSLSDDERVIAAARDALERFGVGGRAARLLGGGCELDARAEVAAAEWLGDEASLFFPSGYQANAGLLTALTGPGAAIFSDRLNHASIIDAARLSRSRVHVFGHLDLEHLEAQLASERTATRRVVVTESVFSMDGDLAPLLELHELCERHDAHLVVDEAHATGLIGPRAAGAWCAVDPDGAIARSPRSRLAARLVTGGKALGVTGAFVVGSRLLREHLSNRARSFVFTTAPSPAISGALCAAIEIASDDDERAERALSLARRFARSLGLPPPAAAIVPFVVGDSREAVALSRSIGESGLDVRAVRPPTVPEGTARLRVAFHAHNSDEAVDTLVARLRVERRQPPVERRGGTGAEMRGDLAPRDAVRARTVIVVGTDTDVGKTVVSAVWARAALRRGPTTYWKPVQTGDASDTRTVAGLAGRGLSVAEPRHEFPLPASPHTAAASAGRRIDFDDVLESLDTLRTHTRGTLIVELAGGLLVPYDARHTQADLIEAARAEIVLVARAGLGTLNHTLLTMEALAARGRRPIALVLVGDRHAANEATLRDRTGLSVYSLEPLVPLDTASIDAWLDRTPHEEWFP